MGNQQPMNGAGGQGGTPPGHGGRDGRHGHAAGGSAGGYAAAAGNQYPTNQFRPETYHKPQGHGAPSQVRGGQQQQDYSFQQQADPMQRTSSDASMTLLDSEKTAAAVAVAEGGSSAQASAILEHWLEDDTVPTVFRWEHGGRQVYITGTFNGWSRQIPMHRSGNDFTYIHNLKRGKHAFKFIVDDEWRFAPDQPTVADIEGRINNFIDVTDFVPYTGDREFEKEKAAAEYGAAAVDSSKPATSSGGTSDELDGVSGDADDDGTAREEDEDTPDKDGEVFSHTMPDLDDYTKEPPPLPPHLRHIILNKPPQLQDTAALPVPQHVALNHLYCTAIKDNMMVLGITQRFKTKFVTTVYYSPCASK